MKSIKLTVAFILAALTSIAFAQQQTAILNSQFRLQGKQELVDLETARYINFAQNDPYIIDYDGVKRSGTISLSKLQANPLWKNYLSVTPFLYINTKGANFKCQNYQTVIAWTGRAPEVANDNCSLISKLISQSDTN